jgi:hypothetical protein
MVQMLRISTLGTSVSAATAGGAVSMMTNTASKTTTPPPNSLQRVSSVEGHSSVVKCRSRHCSSQTFVNGDPDAGPTRAILSLGAGLARLKIHRRMANR